MQQMYKVIIVDNLNRDYKPQGLVTMAISQSNAMCIADLLNRLYESNQHAKVVPVNQPLNLESQHDLVGETLPYNEWLLLTGAGALPEHVAQYWYDTTILGKNPPAVKKSNSFEVNLIILPLTLKEFERNTGNLNAVYILYKEYLQRNIVNHHYGDFETLEEWYQNQIKMSSL